MPSRVRAPEEEPDSLDSTLTAELASASCWGDSLRSIHHYSLTFCDDDTTPR